MIGGFTVYKDIAEKITYYVADIRPLVLLTREFSRAALSQPECEFWRAKVAPDYYNICATRGATVKLLENYCSRSIPLMLRTPQANVEIVKYIVSQGVVLDHHEIAYARTIDVLEYYMDVIPSADNKLVVQQAVEKFLFQGHYKLAKYMVDRYRGNICLSDSTVSRIFSEARTNNYAGTMEFLFENEFFQPETVSATIKAVKDNGPTPGDYTVLRLVRKHSLLTFSKQLVYAVVVGATDQLVDLIKHNKVPITAVIHVCGQVPLPRCSDAVVTMLEAYGKAVKVYVVFYLRLVEIGDPTLLERVVRCHAKANHYTVGMAATIALKSILSTPQYNGGRAALMANPPLLELLVDLGADVTVYNIGILRVAIINCNYECFSIVMDSKPTLGVGINDLITLAAVRLASPHVSQMTRQTFKTMHSALIAHRDGRQ